MYIFLVHKEGSYLTQVSSRRVAYALQKPLKKEMGNLEKQQIIVLFDVDESSEQCNSLNLALKWLYLDPVQLNKALI